MRTSKIIGIILVIIGVILTLITITFIIDYVGHIKFVETHGANYGVRDTPPLPIIPLVFGIGLLVFGIVLTIKAKNIYKKCPYCTKYSKVEATICRFCNKDFPKE